jgi:hypothetical protein
LAISMHDVMGEPALTGSFLGWTGEVLWRSALAGLPYVALASTIAGLTRSVWKRALLWSVVLLLQRLGAVVLLRTAPWALLPALIDSRLLTYELSGIVHGASAALFWFALFIALGSWRPRRRSLAITTTNGEAVSCS